ncbi:RNA polymerase sigma factor [Candidatus Hydrogenedentota bacterium]
MTDVELIERILSGEEHLFSELVERYSGYVWATCLSYVRNRSDCEEVVQEIFIQCYQRLDSLRERSSFASWLARMARRHCIDWLRKTSRREAAVSRYEEHLEMTQAPNSGSARDELELEETLAGVRAMIATLPAEHREALLLCYCQGYSSQAAAKYLGISSSAMRKRLERSRSKLRTKATARMEQALASQRQADDFSRKIVAAIPFGQVAWLTEVGTSAAVASKVGLIGGVIIMTKKLIIGIGALAILLVGVEGQRSASKLRNEVESLNEELAEATGDLEQAGKKIKNMVSESEYRAALAELGKSRSQRERLEEELKLAKAPTVGPITEITVSEAGETTAEEETPATPRTREKKNPLAKMYEGEQGREKAESNARTFVQLWYGDFFNEVNLPDEDEHQVRELMIAFMTEGLLKGVKSAGQEINRAADEERAEKERERLRDEMSQYLTYEELAVWDEYIATMDERAVRKSIDVQLNMFSSGLTPENHELAANAYVGEMMALKSAMEDDPTATTNTSAEARGHAEVQRHIEALANARMRLAEVFDEEQIGHFDRYVELMESKLANEEGRRNRRD